MGKHKHEVANCSTEALAKIKKKDFEKPNPLPARDSIYPFNKLEVGKSILFDLDEINKQDKSELFRAMNLAVRRYNAAYKDLFVVIKHRWDLRVSGYKYLEIARIK